MATLERSIRGLHRHVVVSTRANIHELFDANKYGTMLPLPEFNLEFKDPTGKLEFSFHLNNNYWNPRTEEKLEGLIIACEPLVENFPPPNVLPRYWRIKVRFDVRFLEHSMDGRVAMVVHEPVDTFLNYDSVTKKAKLDDDRFYRKFTRWHDAKEGSPYGTGLYFNGRRIAREAEPKPPWELAKDKPFEDIAPFVDTQTYNAFGQMFQYNTIGEVGDLFDRSTEDEIIRIGVGVSVFTLQTMKQALIQLGYQPKK